MKYATYLSFKGSMEIVRVAMGIHRATSYANIYIARGLYQPIRTLYLIDGKVTLDYILKVFDDLIKVFLGTILCGIY